MQFDHGWLLQNLERAKIGMLEDGTAVGSALATAVNRLEPSTAKSTLGSICLKRSTTAPVPMSGEQLDHTAPTVAHARNAASVSGMFGMYDTTRSPGRMPIARKLAAKLA